MLKFAIVQVCLLLAACGANSSIDKKSADVSPSISLDLTDAVGVALAPLPAAAPSLGKSSESSSTNQPFVKVHTDGTLGPAIEGHLVVRKMLTSGEHLFLVTDSAEMPDGSRCSFMHAKKRDETFRCIDDQIKSIVWEDTSAFKSRPIQFDQNHNVYYRFHAGSGQAIRKNEDGKATDLVNDNISIEQFEVAPNGDAYISGKTLSSEAAWVRRITTAGSLEKVVSSTSARWMAFFPDGNLYIGLWGDKYWGVYRYLTSSGNLDATAWFGLDKDGTSDPRYYDCSSYPYAVRGYCGASIMGLHTTSSGKVFAVSGSQADGVLMQYFPTVTQPTTSIAKVSTISPVNDDLAIAGLDTAGNNSLVLYATDVSSEVDLMNGENIEVYHLGYSTQDDTLFFDGLRFADNQVVICSVVITNPASMSCKATGTKKLEALEFFKEP